MTRAKAWAILLDGVAIITFVVSGFSWFLFVPLLIFTLYAFRPRRRQKR